MQLSNLDEVLEVREPDEQVSEVLSPALACYTVTSIKDFIQLVQKMKLTAKALSNSEANYHGFQHLFEDFE